MNQPKALRLAEMLEEGMSWCIDDEEIVSELRRLHEVNTHLIGALQSVESWWLSEPRDGGAPYCIFAVRAALIKAQGENNET